LEKQEVDQDTLFSRLYQLITSSEKNEKIGGFLATNKILKVVRETKIVHFVNHVMPHVFKQMSFNDDDVLRKGAECLGNLATAGGATVADTIEKRFDDCLEWLTDEKRGFILARKAN
jgi:hypothetical protein